jgi:Asp-tRNA(Asn)/Glu-tRNA(Gln) amidotransferase B subunit
MRELYFASRGYYVSPEKFAELIHLVSIGFVSQDNAKKVLRIMWEEGKENYQYNIGVLYEIQKG